MTEAMDFWVPALCEPMVFATKEAIERETGESAPLDSAICRRSATVPSPTLHPVPKITDIAHQPRNPAAGHRLSAITLEEQILNIFPILRAGDDLFLFEKNHYRLLTDSDARALILKTLREELRQSNATALLSSILTVLKSESAILATPDANRLHVAVANGILDVGSLKLYPPNPNEFLTRYLDVPWLVSQPCPVFERFLREIAEADDCLITRIYEAIGYLLVGDYRAKRFVLFEGPGDSGKSVLGNTIASFFPEENVAGLSIHQLGERFALSFLARRHLNISMDLPDGIIMGKAIAAIKQITGRDYVSIEPKGKQAYSAHLGCKFLFGSNHPLVLRQQDDAFANRILRIPFTHAIPKERQDTELRERIKAELPGILYRALSAYQNLIRKGFHFAGEDRFGFRPSDIRVVKSPDAIIANFAESCLELCEMDSSFVPTEDLHANYVRFCQNSGENAITDKASFSRRLNNVLEGKIRPKKQRVAGIPVNGYCGVKLKGE